MTARPRCIVVVAYGATTLLAQTLGALASTEQVLVIDNSSSLDVKTVAQIAGFRYIDPGRNLGFAGGVNVALRRLEERAAEVDVLLLNPDAMISSRQIDELQSAFDRKGNEDVAAVSPVLVSPESTAQRVSWPFPSPAGMWRDAFGFGSSNADRRFVVGAVLLLRREALASIGAFDERYFLYAEEADWQRRALELGWRSLVAADVIALHVGAGTSVDSRQRDVRFHAGQETYIRRWFGPMGWASYRAAAILGAAARMAMTTGLKRRRARARAAIYLAGPLRKAGGAPSRASLRLTHVVVTGNAAGTERYVSEVATLQAALGHHVTVIGGGEKYMLSALPKSVTWRSGLTFKEAASSLRSAGSQDIVHTHLTSADLVGVLTAPWHGAKVVSTRHIAKRRGGSLPIRLACRVLQHRIAIEICISEYVKRAVGVPATVLTNGVGMDRRHANIAAKVVVLAQRLEPEKATEVALGGWAASGLAAHGWNLAVCGAGTQLKPLQHLADQRGIAGITWEGWVDDLRTAMLGAAVLLAPAPNEPFGLTVVEAMSVGLPVVAAAGGGHLETVGRCPEAALFPPGDIEECGRQLASIAALSDVDRAAYGEALKNVQQSNFDLDEHVRRLDEIYRSVLP